MTFNIPIQDKYGDYIKKIDSLIARSELPGQYIGGESGCVPGKFEGHEFFCSLVFPEIYSMGMSNLGMRIMYNMANSIEGIRCERSFLPQMDMYNMLKEMGLSSFTIESRLPLSDSDVIAFSLMHEQSYTNMLAILSLAGIPLRSCDRDSSHPIIIAGGASLYNPEPVADFLDVAAIGEGEPIFPELLKRLKNAKANKLDRESTLKSLKDLEGAYIPCFYEKITGPSGFIIRVPKEGADVPSRVTKAWVRDFQELDISAHGFDKDWLVPFVRTVHDRVILEIMRGCTNGCRFCQAGMVYRPRREKSVDFIMQEAEKALKSSGYDEIALLSLSSSDHSGIREIVARAVEKYFAEKVSISLPSLRADRDSVEILQSISRVKKSGLTFAPEAGSEKLRYIINKNITPEVLENAIDEAVKRGWRKVKLYFMTGLPTEDETDIDAIIDLVRYLSRRFKINFNITVSAFIPKPHTPFQWSPMLDRDTSHQRMSRIKTDLKSGRIKVNFASVEEAWVEGVLSRGDARVADFVEAAFHNGAIMGAFSEYYNEKAWKDAAQEVGIDIQKYLEFKVEDDEILPWDHIDPLITREFLKREWNKAVNHELTPPCSKEHCSSCGVNRRYCRH